jgi:hypothetical protein
MQQRACGISGLEPGNGGREDGCFSGADRPESRLAGAVCHGEQKTCRVFPDAEASKRSAVFPNASSRSR